MNAYKEGLEDEDFDGSQHFQMNIVILEARHLAIANSDSKVVVTVGNRRKTLRSKTAKTDAPYFNELCIFNFYLPLSVLLDKILNIKIYGVTKLRRNRLIGSFSVELATIWVQPNHQFHHKWAVLTDPKNPAAGVKGYLKCDIGLLTQGTKSRPIDHDPGENIEEHLLVPYGEVNDRQRAKFVFSVFRADNFSNYFYRQPLRSLYAYVRITYAGTSGKTSVASNTFNPFWNEELAFVDMIPALCQYVHIEICDAFKTTSRGILGSANLDLRKLSHESENGFLPTYGPAFLYLYQNFGKFERHNKCCFVNSSYTYMCRLLMALRTEVVDYAEDVLAKKANMLVVKPKSIPSLDESKYFEYKEFILFAAVFDILLFDASIVTSKLSIRVNIGPDKPFENDATLKSPVELKPALKKLDLNEDDKEEKISVKSKKTVTFENSEDSPRTDSKILDEEEPGKNEADVSDFPDSSAQPNFEKTQSKGTSAGLRSKFGEWKPLKNLEYWPSKWRFESSLPRSTQSNRLKNWKVYNSTREWKPLKEMQNWPTEWRRKRKHEDLSGPEAKEERKPWKRIKLGHSPREGKFIKRLRKLSPEWMKMRRKEIGSETEQNESTVESQPSPMSIVGSVLVSYGSNEDAKTDSQHTKLESDEEGQIKQSKRVFGESADPKRENGKSKLYFTKPFISSEPLKSLRTWPKDWKAGAGKKRLQSSKIRKIFTSDEDHKISKRRRIREWIHERGTNSRIVSPKDWEYWKKVKVLAAEWKVKARRYSDTQSTTDSDGKYNPQKRNLWRKVISATETQNSDVNGRNSLKWKESLKNWKTAKILREWPPKLKRRKRKRSSTSPEEDISSVTDTDTQDRPTKKIFGGITEWRKMKEESSYSSIEQISSSTEVPVNHDLIQRNLIERRTQYITVGASTSDIIDLNTRKKNEWKEDPRKGKLGKSESSSSEMDRISDRIEKRKLDSIRKVMTSLREWPTEWRVRGKFRRFKRPRTNFSKRNESKFSNLREFDGWIKKDSSSSANEKALVRSDVPDYQTSPERSTENTSSALPDQFEPARPPPTGDGFPLTKYVSEDSISIDAPYIHGRLERTESEESIWSAKPIWSNEQIQDKVTRSEHSLIGKADSKNKTLGNSNESDEDKRSTKFSGKIRGVNFTDFKQEANELPTKRKEERRGDWQGYESVEKESSTLDESDTSSVTGEGLRRKCKIRKKRKPASKYSGSVDTTDSEEDKDSDKTSSESRSDTDTSSTTSSEDDDDTSSELEQNRKCILKRKSTDKDSECDACFEEALKSARSKKRYWYIENKPRLFSPANSAETNIKVYFAFKNGNLGYRGMKNITVNHAKVQHLDKSVAKDKSRGTERKRWKFWHRKRKKTSNSKEMDDEVTSPSEDEVQESKTIQENLWPQKDKKQNGIHDGSSLEDDETDKSQVDKSQDVNLHNEETVNEQTIEEEGRNESSLSSDEEGEHSNDVMVKGRKSKSNGKKARRRKTEKQKVLHDPEDRGSSSDEEIMLNDEGELEDKKKREDEDRLGISGSHAKQGKWRFWSRKKKASPKPKKELEFEKEDDVNTKESEIDMTKEVKHVRIYNGCNATIPQPVIIRDHYGYTTFSGKYPCLHINGEWPNALRRMYRSNVIEKSITKLKNGIQDVENELTSDNKIEASEKLKKTCQDLSENCKEILSMTGTIEAEDTNLYRERKRYYHREIREIIAKAEMVSKKKLLIAEDELKRTYLHLSTLQRYAQDPEDSFPDTEIWLIKDGKSVAQHRMQTQKIVFSPNSKERGIRSGKIQSVIVRGREGQEVAKLEIFMWFGLGSHFVECRNMLPSGYEHEPHHCRGTAVPNVPLLLSYEEVHYFECRVHLFQARILVGADANGLADPFVRVIVLDQLKDSQIQKETLNPTWDETLVFSNLTLYGPADYIKDNSITITIEVIDYDYVSKNELIGRTLLKPVVKLNYEDYEPPKLMWEDIRKECSEMGKILLTAELLEISEAELQQSENQAKSLPIPKSIRPHLVGHRLEVLFWGVRELKKKSPRSTRLFVTLECGGKFLSSPILKNTNKGPNFPGTVQTLDLELPEEHDYKPPLIIKLFQTNPLVPGHEIYAGNCIVPSVKAFFCTAVDDKEKKLKEIAFKELLAESNRAKKMEEAETLAREKAKRKKQRWKKLHMRLADILESIAAVFVNFYKRVKCKIQKSCADVDAGHLLDYDDDETLDWWVKYYASKEHKHDSTDTETLVIYEEELEAQPEFRGFSDFIYTFNMVTGKVKKNVESQVLVGKVKAAIKLYRWPLEEGSYHTLYGFDIKKGILKQLPSNAAIKYVARIYVISCKNLTPKDLSGKSDPYLVLQVGNQRINDEKNYIPKQVNPVFGKCFEFKGVFPKEHLLRIKVMDHDVLTKDDLIGETFIDLESRYYTKHHASCGLPRTYSKTGYTAWRDVFRPTEILKTVCKQSNMEQPVYTNKGVRIGEYEFQAMTTNEKYKDEMHALAALKRWHEIPLHGFHLVPEHIETRALYHPSFPGVEQGQIEMWIDIFPADFRYVPPIVDIEPRKPVAMELRAIVWNVEGVILDDTTFLFNEKMSDIYVQGWLNAIEEDKQVTDVHYRSMNGEGNFNWRFVFPFKYIATERRLVVYKKQHALDVEPEEMKFPCRLELQVWDNDFFSDDFLGSLNLELSSMPRGAKISTRCKLSMFEETTPKINLFKIRRTRGWWPFRRIVDAESSEYSLTGKIDLELEVMTENEAKENPVGKGREEPKALPEPKRPESSFIWFFNPLKTCRYIICRKYGKYLLMLLAIGMVVAFVLIGIYSFPGYAVKRMLGA